MALHHETAVSLETTLPVELTCCCYETKKTAVIIGEVSSFSENYLTIATEKGASSVYPLHHRNKHQINIIGAEFAELTNCSAPQIRREDAGALTLTFNLGDKKETWAPILSELMRMQERGVTVANYDLAEGKLPTLEGL